MLLILGFIFSVLMGMVLGAIGGGGSILTVPILVYLMGVEPSTATGYSLFIVGLTALFGTYTYFKQGLIEFRTAIIFAIPSIIAVYLTRYLLMPAIPTDLFNIGDVIITKDLAIMVFFALLMLASATMMLRKSKVQASATNTSPNVLLIIAEGALVGVATGVLGAGGGFLIIPALVLLMGMEMKKAVGASLFIIALKSLIGFIGDVQRGIELDWALLVPMIICTFIGMLIASKLAKHLDGQKLQKGFAIFTLTIAVLIIAKEIL